MTLTAGLARAASGASYDEVLGAVSDLLINVLRQRHSSLSDASGHLALLHERMQEALRTQCYLPNGSRKATLLPTLEDLMAMGY